MDLDYDDISIDNDGYRVGSCRTCEYAVHIAKDKHCYCNKRNCDVKWLDPWGVSLASNNDYYECNHYKHIEMNSPIQSLEALVGGV